MHSLKDLHSQLDEDLNINSSDSLVSTLYYTDLINDQRSLMIRNEYNRNREFSPNIQQTIPCLELVLAEPHGCCEAIPVGCKILRTKERIPNSIKLHHKQTITSIGPVIITKKRFTLIDYSRVPYVGEGRTTSNSIYAFIYDGYIYVFSKRDDLDLLRKITVRGIFEDPTALAKLTDCSGKACWSPDDEYPLSTWMWNYIKPQVLNSLRTKLGIPVDNINNSKDDITGNLGGSSRRQKQPKQDE